MEIFLLENSLISLLGSGARHLRERHDNFLLISRPEHVSAAKEINVSNIITRCGASSREICLPLNRYFC